MKCGKIFRSKRTELRKKNCEKKVIAEPIREKFLDFREKTFLLITLELLDRSS